MSEEFKVGDRVRWEAPLGINVYEGTVAHVGKNDVLVEQVADYFGSGKGRPAPAETFTRRPDGFYPRGMRSSGRSGIANPERCRLRHTK